MEKVLNLKSKTQLTIYSTTYTSRHNPVKHHTYSYFLPDASNCYTIDRNNKNQTKQMNRKGPTNKQHKELIFSIYEKLKQQLKHKQQTTQNRSI